MRSLDEQCARALGYNCVCDEAPIDCPIHNYADPDVLMPYSTDPAASRLLEDEIERQGKQIGYVMALMRMLNTRQVSGMDEKWALIRATPEQRARAFLATLAT